MILYRLHQTTSHHDLAIVFNSRGLIRGSDPLPLAPLHRIMTLCGALGYSLACFWDALELACRNVTLSCRWVVHKSGSMHIEQVLSCRVSLLIRELSLANFQLH